MIICLSFITGTLQGFGRTGSAHGTWHTMHTMHCHVVLGRWSLKCSRNVDRRVVTSCNELFWTTSLDQIATPSLSPTKNLSDQAF